LRGDGICVFPQPGLLRQNAMPRAAWWGFPCTRRCGNCTRKARIRFTRTLRSFTKMPFAHGVRRGAVAEPLYEGIARLIEQLAGENWQLAVATGKSDRGLAHCLAAHGLTRHFVSLQTADRHPSKPDPSMIEQCIADAGADRARTVMIGDTVYDIAMACNAGVIGLGLIGAITKHTN
jgi:phosphoglycolate phosphatase-like HAD superfamily hydrolase